MREKKKKKKQVAPRSWQLRIPIVIHQQRRDLRRVGAAAHLSSADLLRETRKAFPSAPDENPPFLTADRADTVTASSDAPPRCYMPSMCRSCDKQVLSSSQSSVTLISCCAGTRSRTLSSKEGGREHISSSWYVALMWSSCSVFTQLFCEDDLKDTRVFSFK